MRKLDKSIELIKENEDYLFKLTPFHTPVLKSGKGSKVVDVDGNEYLDLMSGQFSLPLGNGNKEFTKLLAAQAEKIIHTNTMYLSEEVLKGVKVLGSITAKDLNKSSFLSTGAEAVEFAIRHAKFYTGKEGIAAIDRGYHGLTLATQSITNEGIYAKPIVPKSYFIPTPNYLNRPSGVSIEDYMQDCLNKSRSILEAHKGEIAAIIIEPIISVGGMIVLTKEYMNGIQEIVNEHEALLILDECQTGLGRVGKWFGYEYFNVVPDILVLAKGAGLGLPTSIVVFKDHIAKSLEGKIMHFSSHQNDPISGASIEFLINYMKKNDTLNTINKRGEYLLKSLKDVSIESTLIKNPRGLGLMIGFDLPEELFSESFNPGKELILLLEEEGILIQATRRGKTFRILPSYEIEEKEIDMFITKLEKCMRLLEQKVSFA